MCHGQRVTPIHGISLLLAPPLAMHHALSSRALCVLWTYRDFLLSPSQSAERKSKAVTSLDDAMRKNVLRRTAMINDPNRLSLNFHYYKTLGNFSLDLIASNIIYNNRKKDTTSEAWQKRSKTLVVSPLAVVFFFSIEQPETTLSCIIGWWRTTQRELPI
jgi:hypothetical protein